MNAIGLANELALTTRALFRLMFVFEIAIIPTFMPD